MKITMYECDLCNCAVTSKEAFGIELIQATLFEKQYYRSHTKPEKYLAHHCYECYNNNVLCHLIGIDRNKEERKYESYYREYSQLFYKKVYEKYLSKILP